MESVIQQRQQFLADQSKNLNAENQYEKVMNKIYNVKNHLVIPGRSCYFIFMNSCFGKFIFFLSHVVGFSTIFENIYGLLVRKVTITTKRLISDTNEYPIPALQPDPNQKGGEVCTKMPPSIVPMVTMNMSMQQNQQMMMQNQQIMMQNQQMMQNEQMMMQNQQMMMQNQQIMQNQQMMMQNQQQMMMQQGMPQYAQPGMMPYPQPGMPQYTQPPPQPGYVPPPVPPSEPPT